MTARSRRGSRWAARSGSRQRAAVVISGFDPFMVYLVVLFFVALASLGLDTADQRAWLLDAKD